MHDKPRRPDVLDEAPEQLCHSRRVAGIAGVSAHAMRLFESLKDGFFGVSGCDADTHATFRKQPGATRADARAAADNECNVLYGSLGVAVGLSHVVSSDAFGAGPRRGVATQAASFRDLLLHCNDDLTSCPSGLDVGQSISGLL